MLILIDTGNTRTKWAQMQADGRLTATNVAMNATLEDSPLKKTLLDADKVVIANVAGQAIAQKLSQMVPESATVIFAVVSAEACDVVNDYHIDDLGIDRWTAVLAAWQMNHQPTIVINAGTAITIDAIARDNRAKKGVYMGGMIMPGLQLMHESLKQNTDQLDVRSAGNLVDFPHKTEDAIATGCMNAIVGAVVLQLKKLEKHCAFLPKVVISGGDAGKIAEALKLQLKRVIIAENLVLQGLGLIEKENL